jgi:hypothetical protein
MERQTVLEIDLLRFDGDANRDPQLRSIITTARTLATRSNKDATSFLMRSIGLRALPTRNESYYGLALNYSLALTYGFLDEPSAASEHLEQSGILPYDGGDLIFSEAQRRSLEIAAEQEASLKEKVPAVFLASMPRSASAALSSTISEHFGCPIVRASLGRFPNYYLVPFWVRRLSRGGCVLHDHFGAGQFNQKVLTDCGIRTVFLLIRDPRAAAASFVTLAQEHRDIAVSEERVLHVFETMYLPWLIEWQEFAASSSGVSVIWLRSQDVTAGNDSLRAVIGKVVASLAPVAPSWRPRRLSTISLADANFVSGTSDGWRQLVSKSGQERMWSRIPVVFRDMLELKP